MNEIIFYGATHISAFFFGVLWVVIMNGRVSRRSGVCVCATDDCDSPVHYRTVKVNKSLRYMAEDGVGHA